MTRIVSMILALTIGTAGLATAAEDVIVAGAGPSTAIVTLFFAEFAELSVAEGFSFEVPPRSIKHAGGLRTADDGLFGRTGRPLTTEERGDTRDEIPLARIPLAFVADPDMGVDSLDRQQLVAIYEGKLTNWQQLGGLDAPIRLIGREPGEAAFSVLAGELPCLADADYEKRLHRDHQVVTMLNTDDRRGVLAFGAADNFAAESILEVDGFMAGVAVGLVYNLRNAEHPLVAAVREFSRSEAWFQALEAAGYLAPE